MVPKKVKTGALKVKDRIINSLIYNTYYHSKVNEKIVYLESRDGNDFTGNILRIAEELSTGEYGNYKIYVFAKKEIHPKIKELEETYNLKIHKIIAKEALATRVLEKAKYIIHDSGIRPKYVKRPEQIVLNTWHGTPLKYMGIDNVSEEHRVGNIQHPFLSADYLLYPNDYMREKMMDGYMIEKIYQGKILMEGYPRNSVFFDDERREELKSKLNLSDKEIFVYMPTFKGLFTDRKDEEQKNEVEGYLDELDKELKDNQVLFVKLHQYNQSKLNFNKYNHIKPFVEAYETYDVLNMADVLITDYSSVFFDFANTKRKIVLFNYDEEDSSKLLSVSIDSHATSTIGSNSETVTILAYDVVYTVDGGSETAYSESEPITISGPCTLTAKTIVGNTSSEVATGKYFGAKKDVFTMAIGESLADLDWCTPSFNAETEYLICNFISESSIFNYDVDDSSKPISTKASGTGTINIKLSYNDRMVTQILNNIDSPIATLTINVGEPLNSVFEGENTFGGLYSETNIQVPEGMKAYVITGIDEEKGTVITSPVDFIPAGVPVMLENEGEAKAITHVPYTGSATAPTNNKLNYSNPNTPAQSSSTDNWYVIYNNKFVKVTAGTQVKGGKCYLNLNGTSSSGTRGYYDIDGSDGTTGIREVKSEGVKGEKWNDGEWYTLQGQRVTKPTKPGLYILNGKKVVIK